MIFLINGLIIAGAVVLMAAQVPVQRLISHLPKGIVRRNWLILRVLILFFIVGYIAYAFINHPKNVDLIEFIVPVIFFLGACFVLVVNTLSLQTALDIRRVAELELENITDPLLGINNRRYFDKRVKQEVERSRRYDEPLSLLLLDIDHFKQINDTFGHQVGDLALCSISKLIVMTARTTDVVARYGGEEIMVIATNTPPVSLPIFAERLRKAVEEAILVPADEYGGKQDVRVTVSIGAVTLGPENNTVGAFIKDADEALYRAKNAGRNRVVISAQAPNA